MARGRMTQLQNDLDRSFPDRIILPMPEYYCYILRCADGTLYTGWTVDPGRRLRQHNARRGAHYTRTRRPLHLVYLERMTSRREAMRRERVIKRLSRAAKQDLIRLFTSDEENHVRESQDPMDRR